GGALDDPRAETVPVTANFQRRSLQIPYQTEQRQHLEDVKCWVDLPPPKSLTDAALVRMMIIVPAFAHGDDGQQPIDARVVSGYVPSAAADVREGVEAERRVIEEHGAQEEPDD